MKEKITNEQKWVVGLIEAEGYIGFNRKDKEGRKWIFTVKVSMKDERAINKVKTIMGVGRVHKEANGMVTWKVSDREKIKKGIIPLLERYPLRGIKHYEYTRMKEAMETWEQGGVEKKEKMEELKERSKKEKENPKNRITPVITKESFTKEEEVLEKISKEELREIYSPWWIAGYVEGDGSLEINDRNQLEFELGQMYDTFTVKALHKLLEVPGKVKEREDGYTVVRTKHPQVIEKIIETLDGKMLGSKSKELKVWGAALRTTQQGKKDKARELLKRMREKYKA